MDNNWHWQEPGTAWKGIGIYHMTLTTAGRRPILGKLEIPEQDPAKAYVAETPLAKDLVQCLLHLHECIKCGMQQKGAIARSLLFFCTKSCIFEKFIVILQRKI